MSFDSIFFLACFLPLVLGLYWLVPGNRVKNAILLVLGLVFYAFGSFSGIILLLLSAVINYIFGLLIRSKKAQKPVLIIGIVSNLAFLFAYKYWDFILSDILMQPQLMLGLTAPIGISFFTFKSISYLVDCSKKPEENSSGFWDFLLYLSFFPQIMAGPITRFDHFSAQLALRSKDSAQIAQGARRFILGLAKKVILCAPLGVVVDKVYGLTGSVLDIRLGWLAAICYMLQIYFDFSGYSDMAIGMGTMLGFDTPENFNYPYIAASIGDFWRRWHISLSTWFKDYLYIPLGGNRKGTVRAGLNKAIVFTLCGLWHGCGWTYLLWGLWHGLFSSLESIGAIKPKKLPPIVAHCYTLLVVCLGFVMFRAGPVQEGFAILGTMFTGFHFTVEATIVLHQLINAKTVVIAILGCILATPVAKKIKCPEPFTYFASLLLYCICLASLASGGFTPFIYFKF
jgi:alginate O-acetyltransferase complex protein AlgI